VAFDFAVLGRSPAEKGAPDHSLAYVVRMVAIAAAAALLVLWIELRAARGAGTGSGGSPIAVRPSPGRADSAPGRADTSPGRADPPAGRTLVFTLLPLAAAAAFLALLFASPYQFFAQAREDALLETVQVCMLFAAAGLFAYRYLRGLLGLAARTYLVATALLALGLLLVAMEEISWGQRIFGLETTGIFVSNGQAETNLHNFGTHQVELLYYFGLFVGLVLLAYLGSRAALPRRLRGLSGIVPSTAVLLAAVPAVAFNYGEWDQLTVQLAVFTTLAILVAYLVSALRGRLGLRSAVLPAIALIGLVAVQVALLIEGDSMLRWWQNAEYKELLVALALLLWAVEVARRPAPRSDLPDGDRSRR
jgi:hypothetical protein